MKKTIVVVGVVLFTFCLLFASMAQAAYYMGVVKNVAARTTTGNTIIQVDPGTGETGWVEHPTRGFTARIVILDSDPGSKQALAAVLTALSMGKEIQFEVANTPSWDTQVATSISVAAY